MRGDVAGSCDGRRRSTRGFMTDDDSWSASKIAIAIIAMPVSDWRHPWRHMIYSRATSVGSHVIVCV